LEFISTSVAATSEVLGHCSLTLGRHIAKLLKLLASWILDLDGCEVVSLTQRPRSNLQKHFSASGTHLC
jgi:hypothetical protein